MLPPATAVRFTAAEEPLRWRTPRNRKGDDSGRSPGWRVSALALPSRPFRPVAYLSRARRLQLRGQPWRQAVRPASHLFPFLPPTQAQTGTRVMRICDRIVVSVKTREGCLSVAGRQNDRPAMAVVSGPPAFVFRNASAQARAR